MNTRRFIPGGLDTLKFYPAVLSEDSPLITVLLPDHRHSSNITILRLKKGNRHTMPRSTHNLSLVKLRMPIPPILESLILLQQSHN
jgi:hypothetical protein